MVICGFPGIGKTYTTQNWNFSNIKIYDLDSSDFSWIDKNDYFKGRNPNFPANYIEYIKSIDDENSVILTSSHKEVREVLKAAGIDYYVVYPNLESFGKDFYLDRIRKRENGINSDSFVSLVAENCEDWIKDIEKTTNKKNIIAITKYTELKKVILYIYIEEFKEIQKREHTAPFIAESILYNGNNISEIEKFLGENYTISTERRPNGYCYIHPRNIRFKVNDYIYKRNDEFWVEKGSFDEG
jgi:hypothetical protein